jgi:hypothetical protein
MIKERAAFVASSRCECQAYLSANLDEGRRVLSGSAFLLGSREKAPACSMSPEREVFDIGWQCPFCGRNVLRTFAAAALPRPRRPAA